MTTIHISEKFKETVLDALKSTYQPVTAIEVVNMIHERTGTAFSYEYVNRSLREMSKAGTIHARVETDDERELRLGKNVRGSNATVYYFGMLPSTRTLSTIVDGSVKYRQRKTAGKKTKRKAQARKARTKTVTAASTTTTIDDMIKELRELAEWKRRALTAEANLEKIRNIAGR